MFNRLLRHLALKQSGAILKRKNKDVNKKGKYKQQKKKASYKRQKETSDKGNKHTYNIFTMSSMAH